MTLVDHRAIAADGDEILVLFKEARRRRRRRWTIVALVLTVSLTTPAVLTLARSPSTKTPAAHKNSAASQPAVSAMPAEVLAWSHFRLEVLSSRDGHVIRTLATNVATFRSLPSLSVSPAGTVYFNNGVSGGSLPVDEIFSVPVTGGAARHVANGTSPAVSPDGHFLAYIRNDNAAFTRNDNTIVVENLGSRAIRSWTVRESEFSSLSWAPDSRFLSFTQVASHGTAYLVLDTTAPGQKLGPARRIALAPGVSWAGFMTQTPNGTLGVGVISRHKAISLVAVDARSGRIVRSLVTIPGDLSTGNAVDGPEGTIQADPSGQHLLVAATEPKGYGSGQLYRWSIGTAGPIALGKVTVAAWIPAGIH
jgi:hypothetical protein